MICYPLIVYGRESDGEAAYFDVLDKDRTGQSLIITDEVSPLPGRYRRAGLGGGTQ
ncbi:MAG: hypothetical protein R3F37_18890 [Candidatus Competibacteraceae bacterium]